MDVLKDNSWFPNPEYETIVKTISLIPGDNCRIHIIADSPMAVYVCVPKIKDPFIEVDML